MMQESKMTFQQNKEPKKTANVMKVKKLESGSVRKGLRRGEKECIKMPLQIDGILLVIVMSLCCDVLVILHQKAC